MKESIFEKIRNKLGPIALFVEAMHYGSSTIDKNSLLNKAYNSLNDIKELLNKAEQKYENPS